MLRGKFITNQTFYFQSKLEQETADKQSMEAELRKQIADLESRLSQSQADKQNTEQRLCDDIELLHKTLLCKYFVTVNCCGNQFMKTEKYFF